MSTKTSHFVRPLVALVALVAAMAALLLAYGPNPAQAAGSCSTTSGTTTCTFGPTGSEDTFVVPEGVGTIHVVATGAPGAVGRWWRCRSRCSGERGPGGHPRPDPLRQRRRHPDQRAATALKALPVSVGSTVAGRATSGGRGGGGGGASDVRTISRAQGASLTSRLIVAGGGGGSGQGSRLHRRPQPPRGYRRRCRIGRRQRSDVPSLPEAQAGKAGSQSAGGAGGSPEGQSGSLGLGGNGGGSIGGMAPVAVAAAATTAAAAAEATHPIFASGWWRRRLQPGADRRHRDPRCHHRPIGDHQLHRAGQHCAKHYGPTQHHSGGHRY